MMSLFSLFFILAQILHSQQRIVYVGKTGQVTYVSNPDCLDLQVDWKNGTTISYPTFGNIATAEFYTDGNHLVVRQEGLSYDYSCLANDPSQFRILIRFMFVTVIHTMATEVTLPREGTIMMDGSICALESGDRCRLGTYVENGFKVSSSMLDTNTFLHFQLSPYFGFIMYKLIDESTVEGEIKPFQNCDSQEIILRNTLNCDRTSVQSCLKSTIRYSTVYEFKPGNYYELECRRGNRKYHRRFVTTCPDNQRIENGQCVGNPNTNYILYEYINVLTTFRTTNCQVMVFNGIRCRAPAYCSALSRFINSAGDIQLNGVSSFNTLQCLGNNDSKLWTATVLYTDKLVETPDYDAQEGLQMKLMFRSEIVIVWRQTHSYSRSVMVYPFKNT